MEYFWERLYEAGDGYRSANEFELFDERFLAYLRCTFEPRLPLARPVRSLRN